jgi:P-type E1-E2 ATPase
MLFRSADALEKLADVRTVCFDKTGTLTTGNSAVTSFVAEPPELADVLLASAAGLAQNSTHPLSRAILRHAEERGVSPIQYGNVQSTPGRGMRAPGALLGNPTYLRTAGWTASFGLAQRIDDLESAGETITCVAVDGVGAGVFACSEDLRPAARSTVAALRRRRINVCVLTGDHRARGERLEQQLEITVHARLLPADKIEWIRTYQLSDGSVAMVGDGINDAPALAAADVGIAMACGADVTRESADLTLASDDPADLLRALDLARRAVRVIRQNLFWAFVYNVAGIGLAVAGRLSPVFAALAMVVSSGLVVSNSLRLRKQEPRQIPVGPDH